jgi:hypothetical protein
MSGKCAEQRSPLSLSALSDSSGSAVSLEAVSGEGEGDEDQRNGDAEERYCFLLGLVLTLPTGCVSEELRGRHTDWSAQAFLSLSPFNSLSGFLKIEDTISALIFDCDIWTL